MPAAVAVTLMVPVLSHFFSRCLQCSSSFIAISISKRCANALWVWLRADVY